MSLSYKASIIFEILFLNCKSSKEVIIYRIVPYKILASDNIWSNNFWINHQRNLEIAISN